jgi:2-dehydro-3-deoxyphosphogluconate aldolase / (4S)-4-hydroxy-2-oxoglutarate aldolase
MTKEAVRARIEEIGVIPAIRVYSVPDALFVAEAIAAGGIPIIEIPMTVPGAVDVISEISRNGGETIAGAGTLLDVETARRCLDAGAKFLTSTGLDLSIVEFAAKERVVVFPGALTPTEIITAWRAGADLVKVFPCSQLGSASYIRALKSPFPQIPLIASGGVNQQTATDFILAGAAALGVGKGLMPREAIQLRQAHWIHELARRYVSMVKQAREQRAGG